MAKKSEFIRIRVDDDLKKALREAADREDRQEADQARHILRKALGLTRKEGSSDDSNKKTSRKVDH